MKWKQALADYNLTEETISIGLKKKIQEYYGIKAGVDELKDSINDESTPEEELEDLQNELADLEDSLEEYDIKLVRAIEVYDKNKDKYAELSKNLGKGRPKKNPTPQVVDNQNNNPAPTPTPTPTPTPQGNEPSGDGGEKKKKGFGYFALAIAIGVISLGAVSLFKNND
jgi:hypothetical protein